MNFTSVWIAIRGNERKANIPQLRIMKRTQNKSQFKDFAEIKYVKTNASESSFQSWSCDSPFSKRACLRWYTEGPTQDKATNEISYWSV